MEFREFLKSKKGLKYVSKRMCHSMIIRVQISFSRRHQHYLKKITKILGTKIYYRKITKMKLFSCNFKATGITYLVKLRSNLIKLHQIVSLGHTSAPTHRE